MAIEQGRELEYIKSLVEGAVDTINCEIDYLNDTLERLWKKIALARHFGKPLSKGEYVQFVVGCYNPDGGYGCKPSTTSFLEHTYYAYRIMKALGVKSPRPEFTKSYVLCCQSKKGGFGRSPGGVPFVNTTFYAVSLLSFLAELS